MKQLLQEAGGVVSSPETVSVRFRVQMLEYSKVRKRRRREVGPQDPAGV